MMDIAHNETAPSTLAIAHGRCHRTFSDMDEEIKAYHAG